MPTNQRKSDLKIDVRGKVKLGQVQKLVLHLEEEQKQKVIFSPGGPKEIPPQVERLSWESIKDGIERKGYTYSFEPTEERAHIINDGLTQSYGIFGKPGCGKTFLLKQMLGQLLEYPRKEDIEELKKPENGGHKDANFQDYKFGGLILDPKAALLDDIRNAMADAGRENALIVINIEDMIKNNQPENIIDSFLEPRALGKALGIAAQSAGITSREPSWMNELSVLFGAVLHVLSVIYKAVPTLRDMVENLMTTVNTTEGSNAAPNLIPKIQYEMDSEETKKLLSSKSADEIHDFEISKGIISRFLHHDPRNQAILKSFIDQSYSQFMYSRYNCFSKEISKASERVNLYDRAIEDGKIILVSVSKSDLDISKTLCTLMKVLFQQAVITRLDRYNDDELKNYKRPLFFIADEFSDVATEIEGSSMGDSSFFSLMRQFGCLGIIATQSVHLLRTSSLGERWKAIYSTLAAKIFMTLSDVETAEEASNLVGESEVRFKTIGRHFNHEGVTRDENLDLRDKKDLPVKILTQRLKQGEAAVVGTLDGKTEPVFLFFKAEKYIKEKAAKEAAG